MAKHTDHEQIASILRDASPHWVVLQTHADRARNGALSSNWNSEDRRPPAFRGGGYLFRTRKVPGDDSTHGQPRFLLEGRYIGSGPAPY